MFPNVIGVSSEVVDCLVVLLKTEVVEMAAMPLVMVIPEEPALLLREPPLAIKEPPPFIPPEPTLLF